MRKRTRFVACLSLLQTFGLSQAHACTSLIVPTTEGSYVYGRTMEFGIPLKSEIMVSPRNYEFQGVGNDGKPGSGLNWKSKFAVTGMNALGQPIYVDGMNEKGMSGGLMNAPGTAVYQKPSQADSKNSIASYQMLVYALSNFSTVDEVKKNFSQIFVNSSSLGAYKGIVQVRMQLHDAQGKSIVVEYLDGKLVIHDNPIGVTTNDPPFAWHLTNLDNFVNLTPVEHNSVTIKGQEFTPPSSGSGLHGMPGDMLSTSRFVRAAIYSSSAPKGNAKQQVNTVWHIMDNFDIPPGSINLPASNPYGGGAGGYEITEWTVVADPTNQIYYARTFENPSPQAYDLKKADVNSKELKFIKLNTTPVIQSLN